MAPRSPEQIVKDLMGGGDSGLVGVTAESFLRWLKEAADWGMMPWNRDVSFKRIAQLEAENKQLRTLAEAVDVDLDESPPATADSVVRAMKEIAGLHSKLTENMAKAAEPRIWAPTAQTEPVPENWGESIMGAIMRAYVSGLRDGRKPIGANGR